VIQIKFTVVIALSSQLQGQGGIGADVLVDAAPESELFAAVIEVFVVVARGILRTRRLHWRLPEVVIVVTAVVRLSYDGGELITGVVCVEVTTDVSKCAGVFVRVEAVEAVLVVPTLVTTGTRGAVVVTALTSPESVGESDGDCEGARVGGSVNANVGFTAWLNVAATDVSVFVVVVEVVVRVVASLTIGTPLGRVGVRDGAAVGNGTGAGAVGAVGDWVGENVGADVVTGTGTGVMVGVNVGVAVGVMVGGGLGDGVGDTGAGVGRAVGTAVGVALGALILVHSTVTVAVPVSVLVNRPSSTVWHPTSNATEHCESSALAEPAHKPLWSSFTHGCRMLVSKSVPP